jgi:hypothetical protein
VNHFNACGAPAVLSLSFATQRGVAHIIPMTRRDFGMLCIFTTQKALRENAQPYRFWGLLDFLSRSERTRWRMKSYKNYGLRNISEVKLYFFTFASSN